MGCQGNKDVPTPNIDSLAKNGIRFTSGYVSCPICAQTRAGLMTGRYQQRFGFETNPGSETYADEKFGLPRSETTIAERLKAAGYVIGMFGKWHLGYKPELQPPARGFDEFFGFLSGANNYLPNARRGAARNPILRGAQTVEEKEYLTDAFGREAVAFIEKHHDQPFFVYLPFNAVHAPLEAIEKYLKRFDAIKDTKRRTFAAMLAAMDDNIGRVLATLRQHQLEEQTLIFFLSDNGGTTPQTSSSNVPLRGYKGQVLEGGIREPFIIQWKDHVPAGKVDDRPVIALDIHPTALAAAGVPLSADWKLDGVNLLPYLTGENTGLPHDTLYWRFHDQHAIRRGDWKLVQTRIDPKPQLYNLAQDVSETTDLADKEPAKFKELNDAWNAWNAQLMAPLWRREDARTQGGDAASSRVARRSVGNIEERFKQYDKNEDGKLYCATSYMPPSGRLPEVNPKVLVKKSATSRWEVDLEAGSEFMRLGFMKSVSLTTDGRGHKLPKPVSVLIAGTGAWRSQPTGVVVFSRNDTTAKWTKSVLSTNRWNREKWNHTTEVRCIWDHVDRVTGVHYVFAGAGTGRIYRGVYDPAQPGLIAWDAKPELDDLIGHFLCAAEANGIQYVGVAYGFTGSDERQEHDRPIKDHGLFRRVDGPNARWEWVPIKEWEDPQQPGRSLRIGQLRGMTAAPAPDGKGEVLLAAWDTRDAVIERIDPRANYKTTVELEVRDFFQKAWGRRVGISSFAYNDMLPVTHPVTGEKAHLIGLWLVDPNGEGVEGLAAADIGQSLFVHELAGIWIQAPHLTRYGEGKVDASGLAFHERRRYETQLQRVRFCLPDLLARELAEGDNGAALLGGVYDNHVLPQDRTRS